MIAIFFDEAFPWGLMDIGETVDHIEGCLFLKPSKDNSLI
jgi:hypothetical protein